MLLALLLLLFILAFMSFSFFLVFFSFLFFLSPPRQESKYHEKLSIETLYQGSMMTINFGTDACQGKLYLFVGP